VLFLGWLGPAQFANGKRRRVRSKGRKKKSRTPQGKKTITNYKKNKKQAFSWEGDEGRSPTAPGQKNTAPRRRKTARVLLCPRERKKLPVADPSQAISTRASYAIVEKTVAERSGRKLLILRESARWGQKRVRPFRPPLKKENCFLGKETCEPKAGFLARISSIPCWDVGDKRWEVSKSPR